MSELARLAMEAAAGGTVPLADLARPRQRGGYLDNSLAGLARGIEWVERRIRPSNVLSAETIAGFVPGAGFVAAQDDGLQARQDFREGRYGRGLARLAQGTLNAGLEMIPATAGLPAVRVVPAFHGTTRDVARIIRSEGPSIRPRNTGEPALFLSDDPMNAYQFALMRARMDPRQASVLRGSVAADDLAHFNARGELYDPEMMRDFIQRAQQQGAPGALIRNIQNFEGAAPSTTYAVFDPGLVTFGPRRTGGSF